MCGSDVGSSVPSSRWIASGPCEACGPEPGAMGVPDGTCDQEAGVIEVTIVKRAP